MPVLSDVIGLGRITAAQKDIGVWVRRAASVIAWIRCHWLGNSAWLPEVRKEPTVQRPS
jgi:hypothetical protein